LQAVQELGAALASAPALVPELRRLISLVPAPHCTRVAIDWHGTLDKPKSTEGLPVAAVNLEALRKLHGAGYCIWLCSYIGSGGPDSESRKQAFWSARRFIARYLDLVSDNPTGPGRDVIFGVVVSARLGRNGKTACLREFDTGVLVDDRQDICRDAENAGIAVYRIKIRDWNEQSDNQYFSDFSQLRSFEQAIDALVDRAPIRGYALP